MAGQYLIYLRKSRNDREQEQQSGDFDTLRRHRDALLRLAQNRGYGIGEIFEEVVTGDTISDRPEMQRLLAAVETGAYAGVLVMEIPRLARGNTRDQGIVAETFQYSATKIITPDKIYDPQDEADEEYFEFGLFMSRREYKTINKRLNRGRLASLNEGKYIAGSAPYGYEKVKLAKQKGYTLEIIADKAQVVRRIFQMYVEGLPAPSGQTKPLGSYIIASQLNLDGIPSPGGGRWSADSVRAILKNPVYAGFLRWSYRPVTKRVVGGQVTISEPVSQNPTIVPGIHPPIVTKEVFESAKKTMAGSVHAAIPGARELVNPFVGILFCGACGRTMTQVLDKKNKAFRLMCPRHGCATMSSRVDEVERSLVDSLGKWLADYRIACDQAALVLPKSVDEQAAATVARLEKSLASLQVQRGKLFDLLEQGIYDKATFLERSSILALRIDEVEAALHVAMATKRKQEETEKLRRNVIPNLENVLAQYESLTDPGEKNRLLKCSLDKVLYKKTVGGRYLESNMELFVFPTMDA